MELLEFYDKNDDVLGLGWYAKTSLFGALPSSVPMRGIRVRHGNIEVGNEYFLEEIFAERRFATWHIGEIHLNHNIKPNARRDGFEESSDYESFLEQASVLGRSLSTLCRKLSQIRSSRLNAVKKLSDIEDLLDAVNVFFDEKHFNNVIELAESRLAEIEPIMEKAEHDKALSKRLTKVKKKLRELKVKPLFLLDCLDGRSLRRIGKKELLKDFCREVIATHNGNIAVEQTLIKALKPYFKF